MSTDWYKDVVEFTEDVLDKEVVIAPKDIDIHECYARVDLIEEEIGELIDAMTDAHCDLAKIADGIADSIYVLIGTAIAYGIDIRPIWDEVHKTNMAKKGGPRREDGKLLKPEGWQPPNLSRIIEEQQLRHTDKTLYKVNNNAVISSAIEKISKNIKPGAIIYLTREEFQAISSKRVQILNPLPNVDQQHLDSSQESQGDE